MEINTLPARVGPSVREYPALANTIDRQTGCGSIKEATVSIPKKKKEKILRAKSEERWTMPRLNGTDEPKPKPMPKPARQCLLTKW